MTTPKTDAKATTIENSPPAPGLRPRRTLNRLALAGSGLAAGAVGQYFFSHNGVWEGVLVYLLAAVLFGRALVDHPYPGYRFRLPDPHRPDFWTIYSGWRRHVGLWLALGGLGASLLAYNFFGRDDAPWQAWWLYLASLLLFGGGVLLLTPGAGFSSYWRRLLPSRRVGLGLGLIVALAFLMRLYNFGEQPFGIWFDEAEAGLQARRMLIDPTYRPVLYPAINITGHLLVLYALALEILGDNIYAMRLVSVLFGVGSVVAAYLFGRELRGPRFGLLLAFLLAVARWSINFSRIAMTGIDAPFFEFLALFFLTRLLRRGRLRHALGAGLSLGFGLMFYTAFRLFVLALVMFSLAVGLRWGGQLFRALRRGGWRKYGGALVIILLSIWLVTVPLTQFALDNPEGFWYRTRQISIFTKRDQPNLGLALWQSSRKHLLMFNYQGDKNGRHNLPGEPMLDPVMGLFFVLGLGLALARTRYPANSFFLILLPTALAGGIFSVDFEAPQSLRSIAVIPAAIYFIALALTALGREAEKALSPLPRGWVLAPAGLIAAFMLIFNGYTYFYRQANDFASWNAFSAPETITGRQMAELGPAYVYLLSPFLTNHPTTRFLAPEINDQKFLPLPDPLPVREPADRPVALFIHPDDVWVFDEARRFYPDGQFEVLRGPSPERGIEGPPSVYFLGLETANLRAVRGLELRYWPAAETEPEASLALLPPLHTSRAYQIDLTWPQDSPVETAAFSAEWQGILYAPQYGPYRFRLLAPGPARLELNGETLLEGEGEQTGELTLAKGNHSLRLRVEAGEGPVALYWEPPQGPETLIPEWALYVPPVTNHGLLGSFYPNDDWSGQPSLQRIDPFLDTYFHLIPLRRPYTVAWEGSLLAPQSGLYRLGLRAVQEATLFIDGELVLTTPGPDQYTEASLPLEAGPHDILIRYRDSVDRSRIHLTWIPPSGEFEPIPSRYLWPPLGNLPEQATSPAQARQILPLQLKHRLSLGEPGRGPAQFQEPRDVAVLSNGNLLIADTGNRRVQILAPDYSYLAELTGDEFPFEEPLAVDVLRAGTTEEILVLDSTLQWIYRYSATGQLIERFGGPEARLFHPRGLTVFSDNSLGVADTGSSRVALFSPAGGLLGNLGQFGSGPGQLNEPTDVLKDAEGTYFIAEAETNRIQRLDAGSNPLNQWPIPPAYAFNGPHLSFGPDDSLLMTESQSHALLRYSPEGVLLDQWQTIGPVTFNLPVGLYFDPATNLLYVTDVGTHQIHIFQVETLTEQTGDSQ